jgi:glucan endo-1,3-beta-D-glucosidase
MIKLLTILSYVLPLARAAKIYTGFSYSAFWGNNNSAKTYDDFHKGFSLAKGLAAPVAFDSARLYTCMVHEKTETTPAFDAAVATKTKLLLGFWVSGGVNITIDSQIDKEMAALGNGFAKHGQLLADLVIGLSVGSEDIYRFIRNETNKPGRAEVAMVAAIKKVKQDIAASSFAHFMKDKPIGHVDVAANVVVEGADFYGLTAYPYWHNDTIAKGRESSIETLEGVKQRAGNTEVIIGEMGWPFEGAQREEAVASVQNMQTFWTEMGCLAIGHYTTFWFELVKDAELDQPDWAILDPITNQLRIDLSCPGVPQLTPSAPPAPPASPSPPSLPSPPINGCPADIPPTNSPPANSPPANSPPVISPPANNPSPPISPPDTPTQPSQSPAPVSGPPVNNVSTPNPSNVTLSHSFKQSGSICKSTIHVKTTIMITVEPSTLTSRIGKAKKTKHVTTTITVTMAKPSPTEVAEGGGEDSEEEEVEEESEDADANADANETKAGDEEAGDDAEAQGDEEVTISSTQASKLSAN